MIREYDGMVGTDWQRVGEDEIPIKWTDLGQPHFQWIKNYEGMGKYYIDTMFGQIYFERDEDRSMFLLRWA